MSDSYIQLLIGLLCPKTQHVRTITYHLLSLNRTSSFVLYLRTWHHQQSSYVQKPLLSCPETSPIHHKNCECYLQNVFSIPPFLCTPMSTNLTKLHLFLSLDLLQPPTNWFFCLQLFSLVMSSPCLCKCQLDYVTSLLASQHPSSIHKQMYHQTCFIVRRKLIQRMFNWLSVSPKSFTKRTQS